MKKTKMKHIVFLNYSIQNGGAERVISALANDFVSRGDKVTIVLLEEKKEPGYMLDERVKLVFLGLTKVSKNRLQSLVNMIREIRVFKRCFGMIKPDVIISFQCKNAVLAKIASRKTRVIGSERSNPNRSSDRVDRWLRKMSVIADGFIFQTQGARAFYPKKTAEKAAVIPNGVFLQLPQTLPSYDSRRKVIVTTGRLIKSKRYDLIVDAFAMLREIAPDYRLHIFGIGNEEHKIAERIKGAGLEGAAFLLGLTKNVMEELLTDRIFVMASDYEGMPNGLIEAMACGCACISTNCDFGPSELIENEENGLLVPAGNSKELAEALIKVVSDEKYASYIAQNAMRISQQLSLQTIADRYYTYICGSYMGDR